MKKIITFLFLLLLLGEIANAQASATFSCNNKNGNALTAAGQYCQNSAGANLLPSGTDTHNVYIIPEGTPGSINVIIQGSIIGDFTDVATCGSASTTTTPNLLTCSGIYAAVRVKLVSLTGFTSVNITYNGTSTSTKKNSGGGGTPGGSTTQVQYNNSGAFGGISGATTNGTTLSVTTQAANTNNTTASSTAYVDRAVATGLVAYPACSVSPLPLKGICTVSVSSSQLNALSETFVPFISAQGATKITSINKVDCEFVCSGCTAYTVPVGATLEFYYGSVDTGVGLDPNGFVDGTVSSFATILSPLGATYLTAIPIEPQQGAYALANLVNKDFSLGNSGSDLTTGTGSLFCVVDYNVFTVQ